MTKNITVYIKDRAEMKCRIKESFKEQKKYDTFKSLYARHKSSVTESYYVEMKDRNF
jgi:hypothetical protein